MKQLRIESPQDKGRIFENLWARLFGVKPQKGSGNVWYAKQDVADGSILWQCKSTTHESFRVEKKMMREVQEAIQGEGGSGGSTIPGVAVDVDGEQYVVLRAEDFVRLAQSDDIKYIKPTKSEMKRKRSKMPLLMREDDCT